MYWRGKDGLACHKISTLNILQLLQDKGKIVQREGGCVPYCNEALPPDNTKDNQSVEQIPM
jgi:hypothetical protein